MKISISLPDALVEEIDSARGLVSRSAWIAANLGYKRVTVPTARSGSSRSPKPPEKIEEPRERSYSELPMRERFAILRAEEDQASG